MSLGLPDKSYTVIPSSELVTAQNALSPYAHLMIANGGAARYVLEMLEGYQRRLWSGERTSEYLFQPMFDRGIRETIYFTALRRTSTTGEIGRTGLLVPMGQTITDGVYNYFAPFSGVDSELAWRTNAAAHMMRRVEQMTA